MFNNSLHKVFTAIAEKYNLNKDDLFKTYFNEFNHNNNLLTTYKYLEYELLKDCFNNLYLPDTNNNLDLIGYIDQDNEIVFDKLVQKTINPKIKKPRKSKNEK